MFVDVYMLDIKLLWFSYITVLVSDNQIVLRVSKCQLINSFGKSWQSDRKFGEHSFEWSNGE